MGLPAVGLSSAYGLFGPNLRPLPSEAQGLIIVASVYRGQVCLAELPVLHENSPNV